MKEQEKSIFPALYDTSYRSWLYHYLPSYIKDGSSPETLHRAYFIQYASVFLGIMVLFVLAAVNLVLVPDKHFPDVLDFSTIGCSIFLFINLPLLRYSQSLSLPSLFLLLSSALSLSAVTLGQGGLISPIHGIKGAIIPLALFLLGTKKGILFSLLLPLDLLLNYTLRHYQILPPGPSYVTRPEYIGAVYFVEYAGLLVISSIFELGRIQAQQALEESHEENFEMTVARDAAIQANQAKSMFLANMSHELRTPLNAIIGYAEILQEDAEDLELEEFVTDSSKIHQSGRHLLNIINDILDLSLIESGHIELHNESIHLSHFLEEVQFAIEPSLNSNRFELSCQTEEISIEADAKRLHQILLNLLSNATKFTENGVISLRVDSVQIDARPHVSFVVKDTGIGMTIEQTKKIFHKFTQIDNSFSRKYEGTGLGLAITKELCEVMGGTIEVESQPDLGSSFTVLLPQSVS